MQKYYYLQEIAHIPQTLQLNNIHTQRCEYHTDTTVILPEIYIFLFLLFLFYLSMIYESKLYLCIHTLQVQQQNNHYGQNRIYPTI